MVEFYFHLFTGIAAPRTTHSVQGENGASRRSDLRAVAIEMPEHNHRCAGTHERIVGWRTKTLGIRFGSIDRSDVVVVRRTNIGTGFVHGTQCTASVETTRTKRQNHHLDHSSTVVRNIQFVR